MKLSPTVMVVGLLVALSGTVGGSAQAAEGDLDPSFGTDGIVVTEFEGGPASAVAVAVQPDGKIVAAGRADGVLSLTDTNFGLVRYNQDGSLDPAFGTGGKVLTDFGTVNDQANGMAIQSDGKIVVAGDNLRDALVARYQPDGSLDPSFASGVVTAGLAGSYRARSLAIQRDGRIIVAGAFLPEGASIFNEILIMRFLGDGTLDPTFGSGGVVTTPGGSAVGVAVQGDGKIVVAGLLQTSFEECSPMDPCGVAIVLARYNQDGSLDASFGGGGIVTTGRPGETNETHGMALQADGKIVVVGARPTASESPKVVADFLVHRYNSDGTLDASFGDGGEVVTDYGTYGVAGAAVLQVDGRIVVSGGLRAIGAEDGLEFAIARYNTDGALDVPFGDGGKVFVDVDGASFAEALTVQANGDIVAAGYGGDDTRGFVLVRVMGTRPLPSGPVGLVDPSTGTWYLRDEWGVVDSFYYGNPGDAPFTGDWDGDGIETPGLYRQSDGFVYLRNSNTQGIADVRFSFGSPGDVPLAGDFDGDGFDTVSIYRPSNQTFYVVNELGDNEAGLGAAEYDFVFGNPGDQPVVGDWDGDGIDEIGLHRASTGFFYYRDTLTTGIADGEFYFGNPSDRFVGGDWGIIDGRDTPAVFRPSNTVFYFRHTLTEGVADSQFTWPEADASWIPVAGYFGAP
jgi:uncharacterized delta-60 repeat protein